MGKTKLFTEPENNSNSNNPFFKRPVRQKYPISERQPGPQANEIPVGVLLLQIQIRLRRWWIALRFQADRLTLGRGAVRAGAAPDLYNLPPGCPYQNRCPRAQPVCQGELMPLPVDEAHGARCHFPEAGP